MTATTIAFIKQQVLNYDMTYDEIDEYIEYLLKPRNTAAGCFSQKRT